MILNKKKSTYFGWGVGQTVFMFPFRIKIYKYGCILSAMFLKFCTDHLSLSFLQISYAISMKHGLFQVHLLKSFCDITANITRRMLTSRTARRQAKIVTFLLRENFHTKVRRRNVHVNEYDFILKKNPNIFLMSFILKFPSSTYVIFL